MANVLPYLVIVLSRFLAKGWFTHSIECCTLLLVMGSCCMPCLIIMLNYSLYLSDDVIGILLCIDFTILS